MRLTMIMFFGKKPYGYKYRGKHRVVVEPKINDLANLRYKYERIEKNMLILRHPYLTVEQSYGHMALDKDYKKEMAIAVHYKFRNDKFSKHVTLAERLAHLKVKDAWD
ncbi:uncharacterized protein LOC106643266 [Copidosoma floridanum]|uniref:uncharacterized protein LOC106643266 n=1 Tax=Copidosoma floridanum TaxID=29053 RepID=UPI0006C983F4|nr:uncharacterized protein LOC106643266 [Copidosoma floridanum]